MKMSGLIKHYTLSISLSFINLNQRLINENRTRCIACLCLVPGLKTFFSFFHWTSATHILVVQKLNSLDCLKINYMHKDHVLGNSCKDS